MTVGLLITWGLMPAINRDLEPFWGLSATQIEDRRRTFFQEADSDHFLPITIRNGVMGEDDSRASTKLWYVGHALDGVVLSTLAVLEHD